MKQNWSELHSQALTEDSIIMGASYSKKSSGTEKAEHKGQQFLHSSHNMRKQMNLELLQPNAQEEKDLMSSKYNKDLASPLL